MTQQPHTFQIKNPGSTRRGPNNMVALKRIQNYCYFLSDEIGLGFTSHVYKGKCQLTKKPVAVKVIQKKNTQDQLQVQFLNDQVAALEKIKMADSVNLLKLECVIKTKNNLYIITELCEGKDLAKILRKKKKMNQIQAQSIMKQVLNGYKQLYNLKIVHRDLKLANLFITKGRVKIADFGFAISEAQCHKKMDYNVGSPFYMPPQALKDNQYSYFSDVWGFGVIAYQLIYGRVPWKDKDDHVLYDMMSNCPVQNCFDDGIRLSDHYKNFIISCLKVNLNERASPEFIINYPWPQAKQYVEGMEEFERGESIGRPMNHYQHVNKSQSIIPVNGRDNKNQHSVQNRKKSRSIDRRNTAIENNQASRGRKQSLKPQSLQIENEAKYSEYAILGQLHYCRFMFQLYKLLKNCPPTANNQFLIGQLCHNIIEKISAIQRIFQTTENIFKSPGFNAFKSSQAWPNLKNMVQKYSAKYRSTLGAENKNFFTKKIQQIENLQGLIKQMKSKLPAHINVLQQVVYYWQIKDLEEKQNYHTFYERSKINYLVDQSYFEQNTPINANKMQQIRDRLVKKLEMLSII